MVDFKTRDDVVMAGGVLVDERSGETWNDGGHWFSWVYYVPSTAEHWLVHRPTNYRSDVEITRVVPRVVTWIEYDKKERN